MGGEGGKKRVREGRRRTKLGPREKVEVGTSKSKKEKLFSSSSLLPAPINHSEEMGPLRTSKLCLEEKIVWREVMERERESERERKGEVGVEEES